MKKLVALLLVLILMMGLGGCSRKMEEKAKVMVPIGLQVGDKKTGMLTWISFDAESIMVVGAIADGDDWIDFEYEKNLNTGTAEFRETAYEQEKVCYRIDSIDITEIAVFSVGEIVVYHQKGDTLSYYADVTDCTDVVRHTLKTDINFEYDDNENCIQFAENGECTLVVNEDIDSFCSNSDWSVEMRNVLENNAQTVFFELMHVIRHVYA